MKAKITITLKPGLLDAQGKTIHGALASLGFRGVTSVRMGKYLEIELNHHAVGQAKRDIERMCQRLLANPVVEQYHIELVQGARGTGRGGTPRSYRLQPRARAKRA